MLLRPYVVMKQPRKMFEAVAENVERLAYTLRGV